MCLCREGKSGKEGERHFWRHGHNDDYVDCNVLIKLNDHARSDCGNAKDGHHSSPKIAEKVPERLFISTKLRSCLPHEDKASR